MQLTVKYKLNKEKYLGSTANACEVIRVCVTSEVMTPDLYEIMKEEEE